MPTPQEFLEMSNDIFYLCESFATKKYCLTSLEKSSIWVRSSVIASIDIHKYSLSGYEMRSVKTTVNRSH
ncbi:MULTISPECIES: hypothetical protein [Aerosakkonema]|uniref:hypothetical protein n=1 Tax=Aerosakkonema TaxID=1246629 RepID=UPI0035BC70F2